MTPEHIDAAAGALVAARTGRPITALPEAARPRSEANSYAIQDAVVRRLGERIGGWKVGFSPEGGVFCAPIYASRVWEPRRAAGERFSPARHRVRDRLSHQRGDRRAGAALHRRGGAGGCDVAPDDRGRRFALPRFPLARQAADPGRQFLEWRTGLWRGGHGLAGP